jgi:hypothetical protein
VVGCFECGDIHSCSVKEVGNFLISCETISFLKENFSVELVIELFFARSPRETRTLSHMQSILL